MRVALAVDWFLKYASEQAIGLQHAGAEVHLVCREHLQEFDGSREEWEAVLTKLRQAGVYVHVMAGRTGSARAASDCVVVRRRLSAWRPDIVHAHPSIDPWLHLTTLRFPLVLTVHDVLHHPGQPRHDVVRRSISDAWRKRADGFIVHGEALARELRPQVPRRPIAVVPHGVAPASQAYPAPTRASLLFFGRLEPYKGLHILMEAMRELWEERPDVELVVAGRGPSADQVPEHPQIKRLIRYIPEGEIDDLLRAASLVVAPYTEASQSGVVALAAARGIPVVVSDQGALAEAALDESFVVPAGDSHALARAVADHLDDDGRIRASVHAMAVERLSWDAAGSLTLAFYRQVLAA